MIYTLEELCNAHILRSETVPDPIQYSLDKFGYVCFSQPVTYLDKPIVLKPSQRIYSTNNDNRLVPKFTNDWVIKISSVPANFQEIKSNTIIEGITLDCSQNNGIQILQSRLVQVRNCNFLGKSKKYTGILIDDQIVDQNEGCAWNLIENSRFFQLKVGIELNTTINQSIGSFNNRNKLSNLWIQSCEIGAKLINSNTNNFDMVNTQNCEVGLELVNARRNRIFGFHESNNIIDFKMDKFSYDNFFEGQFKQTTQELGRNKANKYSQE